MLIDFYAFFRPVRKNTPKTPDIFLKISSPERAKKEKITANL